MPVKGMGVQVPPRTHRDHDLTCGYAIGEHSPESGARLFPQVRTMGVQVGSRLRNGNSHRQPTGLRILRDVHKREVVASGSYWANTPWLDASFRGRAHCATVDLGHFLDSANPSSQ